jgi:hypothetical protein
VVGNYDPENPDAFDPDDLTTYGVGAEAGGINFNGPNCQHATVLDTHISGVRTAIRLGVRQRHGPHHRHGQLQGRRLERLRRVP